MEGGTPNTEAKVEKSENGEPEAEKLDIPKAKSNVKAEEGRSRGTRQTRSRGTHRTRNMESSIEESRRKTMMVQAISSYEKQNPKSLTL